MRFFMLDWVCHLWEEGRFPGGFGTMIQRTLRFNVDLHFGEAVTAVYVTFIAFLPLFFPQLLFMAIAPALLGVLELIGHTAMIWMFDLPHFYSRTCHRHIPPRSYFCLDDKVCD